MPSLVAATLLYFGFGLSGLLAFSVDGVPVQPFVIAMIAELAVAVLCLHAALTTRRAAS